MYSTRPSIPGTTYRLLEAIPYPRAERRGHLVDASGTRLHGAYERKVAGGYQSALINNGSVLCRYVYGRPAPATFPGDRHSYANLVHCGGYSWGCQATVTRRSPKARPPSTSRGGTGACGTATSYSSGYWLASSRLAASTATPNR